MTVVPPIKSNGIKTKLVPWIIDTVMKCPDFETWTEPFMGTGCVVFNVVASGKFPALKKAVCADINPHLIELYRNIQNGDLNPDNLREYLEVEGENLREYGQETYTEIRNRFNTYNKIDGIGIGRSLDFIFLSRSCFNGLMRFNSKGCFNVPFCKKPERFSKAYITKICNQVRKVSSVINESGVEFEFICQDFRKTVSDADAGTTMIYCDPPYYSRSRDYYNGWNEENEQSLSELLINSSCRFVVSTWKGNEFRKNEALDKYWNDESFNYLENEHFYFSGGKIENRHPVTECLITNF